MENLETKLIPLNFQIEKKQEELDEGKISGYAANFGNLDSWQDKIKKGAFTKTVKEKKEFPILWQHNLDEVLGKTASLFEDDNGLYMSANLVLEVQKASEAIALAKNGALKGLSIGFMAKEFTYKTDKKTQKLYREISEIDLYEISLVTIPANEKSNIDQIKKMELAQKNFVGNTAKIVSSMQQLRNTMKSCK